jgi:hypothetical protein
LVGRKAVVARRFRRLCRALLNLDVAVRVDIDGVQIGRASCRERVLSVFVVVDPVLTVWTVPEDSPTVAVPLAMSISRPLDPSLTFRPSTTAKPSSLFR